MKNVLFQMNCVKNGDRKLPHMFAKRRMVAGGQMKKINKWMDG